MIFEQLDRELMMRVATVCGCQETSHEKLSMHLYFPLLILLFFVLKLYMRTLQHFPTASQQ